MNLILPILAVVLAAGVALLILWGGSQQRLCEGLRREGDALRKQKEELTDQLHRVSAEALRQQGEAARERTEAEAEIRILRERLENQAIERQKLQEQFTHQFRDLANEIFEEKSRRFTEANNRNIGDLLRPLGENIERFRQRIEQESTQRQILEHEIRRLHEMSNQISQEANNLATALRGNSKTQGDWGEMILERLLENSGLQKGMHFLVQQNYKSEEGDDLRPDVVLVLPDNKQIVIDSKVSLTAYANCVGAEDRESRESALDAHVRSVRTHIQGLSSKSYQDLVHSPDFVIMFIPNEPAFLMALQRDGKLWSEAYAKKVILSSPTNLFAILKIVDDLWRRDSQDKYALEIARQGGALYDKFVLFAESFLSIGDALSRTDKVYRTALGQLKEGNGNLMRRAQNLRSLGVKASKNMPSSLVPPDETGAETLEQASQLPD